MGGGKFGVAKPPPKGTTCSGAGTYKIYRPSAAVRSVL